MNKQAPETRDEIKRKYLLKVATFERTLSEYKEPLIRMIYEDNLEFIQLSMPERNTKERTAKAKAISDHLEKMDEKIAASTKYNIEFYHGLEIANKGSETVNVDCILQNMLDLHNDLNNMILKVCSATSKIETGSIFAALFEECTKEDATIKLGEKYYMIHYEKEPVSLNNTNK